MSYEEHIGDWTSVNYHCFSNIQYSNKMKYFDRYFLIKFCFVLKKLQNNMQMALGVFEGNWLH